MSDASNIEWCDSTFNPWIGCTKVSPGCDNCYAEADFDLRKHRAKWGAGNPRARTSQANWQKPLQWDRQHEQFFAEHGRRRRVFCASLADVFDNEVPAAWRHDLFNLIRDTPHMAWLLLTKRPQNIVRMVEESGCVAGNGMRYLPGHIWLGTSGEDQQRADKNVRALLRAKSLTGAAVAFVSMEPLLGPIDLRLVLGVDRRSPAQPYEGGGINQGIDWVIAGGESGPYARPMHPNWPRNLRDQCAAAGVPFLFKQWGEFTEYECGTDTFKGNEITLTDTGKAWPRSVNCYGGWVEGRVHMRRVGKKAADRLLDGVEHNGYPS